MTQQSGLRTIVITAVAALLVQSTVGIFNNVRAAKQNSEDIVTLQEKIELKADAQRIGEVMERMKEYHDLAMKGDDTNKAELDRLSKRIDDLLLKYNAIRGEMK
jgi:hypothetical protein